MDHTIPDSVRTSGTIGLVHAVVIALALLASSTTAEAQTGTPYSIAESEGLVLQGCLPPSPCDCAVFSIYTLFAQFDLAPVLPPLGPVFEYTIENFEGAFVDLDALIFVEGSGTYTIDVIAGTHAMTLDLLLFGTMPVTYSSFGMVPNAAAGDATDLPVITIDVARDLDGCNYEGLQIVARKDIEFIRGDVNQDGSIDIGDPIGMLGYFFPSAGPIPFPCQAAFDANFDGAVNIADTIYLLGYLFNGGSPPAAPFPNCGTPLLPSPFSCDEPPCPP